MQEEDAASLYDPDEVPAAPSPIAPRQADKVEDLFTKVGLWVENMWCCIMSHVNLTLLLQ